MDISMVYDFAKLLSQNGIMFSYMGPVAQSIIEEIGDVLKTKLEIEKETMTKTLCVFSIFLEQVQNILNYTLKMRHQGMFFPDNELDSIILIGKNKSKFFNMSGNVIDINTKIFLIDYLEKIRLMDQNEIKVLFREKVRHGVLSEGKGAGLGFLEMAKRATEPIEYCFNQIDNQKYFFSLKIII